MKAILTLTFVILSGTLAMAQGPASDQKVDTIIMGIVFETKIETTFGKVESNNTLARIHKFKNDRIKKELVFTSKCTKAKLA